MVDDDASEGAVSNKTKAVRRHSEYSATQHICALRAIHNNNTRNYTELYVKDSAPPSGLDDSLPRSLPHRRHSLAPGSALATSDTLSKSGSGARLLASRAVLHGQSIPRIDSDKWRQLQELTCEGSSVAIADSELGPLPYLIEGGLVISGSNVNDNDTVQVSEVSELQANTRATSLPTEGFPARELKMCSPQSSPTSIRRSRLTLSSLSPPLADTASHKLCLTKSASIDDSEIVSVSSNESYDISGDSDHLTNSASQLSSLSLKQRPYISRYDSAEDLESAVLSRSSSSISSQIETARNGQLESSSPSPLGSGARLLASRAVLHPSQSPSWADRHVAEAVPGGPEQSKRFSCSAIPDDTNVAVLYPVRVQDVCRRTRTQSLGVLSEEAGKINLAQRGRITWRRSPLAGVSAPFPARRRFSYSNQAPRPLDTSRVSPSKSLSAMPTSSARPMVAQRLLCMHLYDDGCTTSEDDTET